MSLLQLLAANPASGARSYSHHHNPVLVGVSPLLLDASSSEDDDLLNLWRLPKHLRRLLASPYYKDHRHNKSLAKAAKPVPSKIDKDHFQVSIDVQQFAPEDISVKVTEGNTITIEGEHKERPDEHGSVYRHFVRRYVLPEGHDIQKVESRLSSDGVLTITAPKINKNKSEVREIPVIQTCKPSVAVPESSSNDAASDSNTK